jgi:hypothetical protein
MAILNSTERRASPRWPLKLPATVTVPCENLNAPCTVIDLSTAGAGLLYGSTSPRQEMVGCLRIHCLGGFDGITTRTGSLQCGFRFVAGEAERMGLKAKLAALISKGPGDYKRVVASRSSGDTMFSLPCSDGSSEPCRVLNISLHAVYLETNRRPPLGQVICLGSVSGRVSAHAGQGVVLTYVDQDDPHLSADPKLFAERVKQSKFFSPRTLL